MADRAWWCPHCEVVGRGSGRCWNCGRVLEVPGRQPVRRLGDLLDDEGATNVAVRDARPDEQEGVAALVLDAYDEFRPFVEPELQELLATDIRDFTRRAGHTQVIVAEQGGRIAGAVTFFPDASRYGQGLPADWAAIRLLAVAPSARGAGLGRALVSACIERARAAGSQALVLHTTTFMETARRLYEAMGFERAPELDARVGPGLTVMGYRLELRP